MPRGTRRRGSKDVLDVVIDLLESHGYSGFTVKTVAAQAQVSLRDVYKDYSTRGELLAAALGRWMQQNVYADMATPPPADTSLHEGLMLGLRRLFEPWERHPRLLEAYHRARMDRYGPELDAQGVAAFGPAARALFDGLDETYVEDLATSLGYVTDGLVARYVKGDIAITDILPKLDRVVLRLTSDNAALSRRAN